MILDKQFENRWFDFSLAEQMANIGSEIGRAINWSKRDIKMSRASFERALELLDLTIIDVKNKKRLKELLRVREMLVDYFYFDNVYQSSDEKWNNYFYAFNYAARLNRV
ncbi:MAG: hypothetical protein A2312_00085 [Candidatus Staskawiczbacteria bacterium RIFOXYB2_FULL_32_9]|uniref:Uncharacterized protein n=1 Tax=Candidatus Staskawiczbacteria bacterium RIFOXYD1_FULL_32_13 TaxID=1802234 RepID=A0A1G2JP45_9BACT|nr:MAG: hypothetical protein UR22_C0006G0035 [Parcubacteria group bacterium GW2011_GWC2_32_10]OGZ78478.1 MAG: hypothetical protein A2360_04140 [Candidatus Staskawiczbacteria bacterium RIFOXYB1_FULL_32_11]OGZ79732.1 MAG: hypothetical protein A2256_01220 [Candidatus Staskawiczbacteria bacterium RIFOXYA2_FULL_32_7]OGZ84866.1 MAG: hypothetical protein A2312_00085 [Candidatus Staskawiczbacteria bacterium RIFOXYB2_FULL_32_9]OGZ85877.1 MAG: hypothetical protein A2463_03110 [Candidatus Staskawiczbacter